MGKYAESHFSVDRSWCPRNFLHTYHLGFPDVPDGGSPVEGERRGDAVAQARDSNTKIELVDVYSPLPEDLRAVLAELTPVDATSGAHIAAWLSGDAGRLPPFERCVDAALSVAGEARAFADKAESK